MTNGERTDVLQFNLFSAGSIFLISLAVTALQISLLGALPVTRYHHFSYLVISTALLGFGASGTFLFYTREKFTGHLFSWFLIFFLLFTVSVPVSYYAAQSIPLDIQYVLYDPWQVILLLGYNLCLFLPFFFAAMIIGMALTFYGQRIPMVYGINLLGSGAGGMIALFGMQFFSLIQLPAMMGILGLCALICWSLSSTIPYRENPGLIIGLNAGASVLILLVFLWQFPVPIDQYKMLAAFQRLEQQGNATQILTTSSPWGRIDAWESDRIHHTLFAGLTANITPPKEITLLHNGDLAGAVFKTRDIQETGILDVTPQSLAYRLLTANSTPSESLKVLLLGEIDGTGIWLAKRYSIGHVTVVQPDPKIIRVMKDDLAVGNGGIFNTDGVYVVQKEPRLFLEHSSETYDIIQMVQAQQMAAAGSGMNALNEDYLLTTESIQRCYDLLTDQGMVTITRGIQSPPRDNIKIFGLFISALEKAGRPQPGDYLLQGRNYLAVNTILMKKPIQQRRTDQYRKFCTELFMDAEYYPGIRSDTLQQRNEIAGPAGENYSYYHYATQRLLSPHRTDFFQQWMYRIAPSTDDRPYFHNFFRWRAFGKFRKAYGQSWYQNLELGSLILVITLLEVTVAAFLLILLPLLKFRAMQRKRDALPVILHFGYIGFAFLFLEMVFIQKFTQFLGHPVYSATAVLTAILIFAGLGSILHEKLPGSAAGRIRMAAAAIVIQAVLSSFGLETSLEYFVTGPFISRFLLVVITLSPISFFMGWMFPSGLVLVESHARDLVPWAWGINGFASVAASPLAILLSMAFGFSRVIALAAFLYFLAGLNSFVLAKSARAPRQGGQI